MKDIKKADWVVIRLLVDVPYSDINRYGRFRPTEEHVKAIMYLHDKYGLKKLNKAIDLIRKEKEVQHERTRSTK
jgi:hypothetical protein